ncbi:MAG: hypothetical protein AAGF23_25295, partial [Acidobacteriota bacterium]
PRKHDPNVQAQAFIPGFDSRGKSEPGEIEIYPGAVTNSSFLLSKMVHESNHIQQYQQPMTATGGPHIYGQAPADHLAAAQEVEAYGSEILSAQYSGLDRAQLTEVWNRYQDHYKLVKPRTGVHRKHLSTDQKQKVDALHRKVHAEHRRLLSVLP